MQPFDRVILGDYSASSRPTPARPVPDAIWIGEIGATGGGNGRLRGCPASLARALWWLSQAGQLDPLFTVPDIASEEGWVLGAGHAPQPDKAFSWG